LHSPPWAPDPIFRFTSRHVTSGGARGFGRAVAHRGRVGSPLPGFALSCLRWGSPARVRPRGVRPSGVRLAPGFALRVRPARVRLEGSPVGGSPCAGVRLAGVRPVGSPRGFAPGFALRPGPKAHPYAPAAAAGPPHCSPGEHQPNPPRRIRCTPCDLRRRGEPWRGRVKANPNPCACEKANPYAEPPPGRTLRRRTPMRPRGGRTHAPWTPGVRPGSRANPAPGFALPRPHEKGRTPLGGTP
jgi:hypothetical protein